MKRMLVLPLLLLGLMAAGCQDALVAPGASDGTAVVQDEAASKRLPGSDQGGRPLTASLTGDAEVPGPGDPDGTGSAVVTLNKGQGTVCFELTVEDIEPATAAHIHLGEAGVAGGVVVPLTPPTDGSSEGCVDEVDGSLIQDMLQNPSGYYVNVHNAEYPGGAVRGQLTK